MLTLITAVAVALCLWAGVLAIGLALTRGREDGT